MEKRLSFPGKISRLRERLRNPEWRKYGKILIMGKLTGVGLILLAALLLNPDLIGFRTFAADPVLKGNDIVNPINTVWTLIAAFLVFGMQVGFTMLEAGFCRSRETVNVLMECVVDTCLCGLLFYAWGFSFMFSHGNGFIGMNWFFLQGAPHTYEGTGVAFLAFWLFQFAFADTCSTITSGAMIGRTAWMGDLLYSFMVSGFIYPIIGHWAWGPDGFLATMGAAGFFLPSVGTGFHDFAGSTVVHTIGGFIALAGAIVLGPRLGRRFKRDGGGPMMPHDLTIAASGGLLLWFGWYGFNPGSTLSAMDFEGIGRVAANTTLAACSAGLAAMFVAYTMSKKWDVSFTVNGFLAGLVAITCPCYWVSPTGAILLGAVAGVIVVYGVELLEYLRIDDPIGAVPVHGMCGIWGTLSLGLFASGQYGATGPFAPDNSAPLKGPVLRRRHAGAGSPDHRQRDHHGLHVRGCHGGDVCRQCHGSPAHLGRRRKLRSGSSRARHFGLPRIRDLFHRTSGWHGAREGDAFLGHRAAPRHSRGRARALDVLGTLVPGTPWGAA